jgi:RND family efflux transporter MFP subunit
VSDTRTPLICILAAAVPLLVTSCNTSSAKGPAVQPAEAQVTVGVVPVKTGSVGRTMNISSELVPFQEIDVFAKESGFVKELPVDYGTVLKKGQLIATLEIPELEIQLQQDDAAIKSAADQITHAEHELNRIEATHKVLHLQFDRLDKVSKTQKGLVAQQEVDDAQGKDLSSEAQVESAQSNLSLSQSQHDAAVAKRQHDQVLFDYARITAPFDGIVTQRMANLGTLVQAGTSSSTNVLPIVRLSQNNLFRLVIPVPEGYVRFIHLGDHVDVNVPALNRTFPGKVARFSVDVREDTRTMHTEVDVPNPQGVLLPGLYAEATITLEHKDNVNVLPLQALDQNGDSTTVDVVDSSGKVQIRKIVPGVQSANETEVVSGLEPGDMVIVSDRSSLKAGQPVKPQIISLIQNPEDRQK